MTFQGAMDAQIAPALQAVPAPAYLQVPRRARAVPAGELRALLLRSGDWGRLVLAQSDQALPEAVRIAAINAVALLSLGDHSVSCGDPQVFAAFQAALAAFEQVGLVSSAVAAQALAIVAPEQSWASHSGVSLEPILSPSQP